MRRLLRPDELYPAGETDVSSRFVTLESGVRLRVAEAGPSDGDPVLFLHGWGASVFMFRHGLTLLSRARMRAIAIDLRGFGLSDKPAADDSYSLTAYRADVDQLLNALSIPSASIVAQSMGAGVGLDYALRHPERVNRLVLINPARLISLWFVTVARALPTRVAETLGKWVTRGQVRWVLERIAFGDPTLVTEREIDEYWSPTKLPGYPHAALASLVEYDWAPVSDADAATLSVPTLVLLGENDHLIHNTVEAAQRLAGARVERVPGGHCAHEEHPDVVYGMVIDFLRRNTTTPETDTNRRS